MLHAYCGRFKGPVLRVLMGKWLDLPLTMRSIFASTLLLHNFRGRFQGFRMLVGKWLENPPLYMQRPASLPVPPSLYRQQLKTTEFKVLKVPTYVVCMIYFEGAAVPREWNSRNTSRYHVLIYVSCMRAIIVKRDS